MIFNELIPKHFARRFTGNAERALEAALRIAKSYPQKKDPQVVSSIHLLYALILQEGSIAKNALQSESISQGAILRFLQKNKTRGESQKELHGVSSSLKKTIKIAASCALENKQNFIGTEHLLWGILKQNEESSPIPQVKLKGLEHYLDDIMLSSLSIDTLANASPKWSASGFAAKKMPMPPKDFFVREPEHQHDLMPARREAIKIKEHGKTILEEFCKDLSVAASQGMLDPVIGREEELDRVVRILSRRNKNNPLLIGEPGVGKTALVNGLALRIMEQKVPQNLRGKKIYSLNLSSLIAGTMFRGEFEERMRDLVEEASAEDIILFIDEVHTLVGAGSAQGSMDAANILKPALVHGEFQCIGATTFDEYKKSIEKDGALERRFQKLIIQQETPQQSLQTLNRLRPLYEKHHNVEITEDIIRMTVDMAVIYLPQRALPDKALDILDEAASYTRSQNQNNEKAHHASELQEQLHEIILQKDRALSHQYYKKALELKTRQEILENAIAAYRESLGITKYPRVKEEAVYRAVAEIAGMPLSSIRDNQYATLQNLEHTLRTYIIGQETAIRHIAQAIRRNNAGIRTHNRPVGSFMFLGPSGVGKTELARVLASILEGKDPASPQAPQTLIKLDMSEFAESHTVARLIGAPPGYVGYEEAGHLTERIRRTPHAVVLFDEMEKAHPRVFNLLLQILEDGVLTDSHGRAADFKNAIIIMSSNIGSERMNPNTRLGFTASEANHVKSVAMSSLKDILRPEIINRIDNIVVFEALDKNSLQRIAKLQLEELVKRLKNKIDIYISPAVCNWVAQKAAGDAGARGIRRTIETELEEHIAECIIKNQSAKLHIGIRGKNLIFAEK